MKKGRIKVNFVYQITYQILVLALPFLISPYVSRKLGAEGLGIYSYSYSVAYFFVLISMLGILNYGNRAIAKVRDDKELLDRTFSEVLTLHIVIAFFACLLYVNYVLFVADSKLYAGIQLIYVLSSMFDITWLYYGLEKFKSTVTRNIIIKIMTFSAVFLLIHDKSDIWKYCLIMAFSFLASQIILWTPLKKNVSYVRVSRDGVLRHLKPMLLLFIPTVAVSLYRYMDKVMIGMLSNKSQLGFYENAEMLNQAVLSIITSVGTVLLPQMSNLVTKGDWKKYKKYLNVSMRYVMIMAWAFSFGLSSVANIFAPLYWGDEFSDVGKIVQVLTITVPFISFANVLRTQYLLPFEKDKEYTISVVVGSLINVAVNLILIPRYEAIGASVATVCAEAAVCIVQTLQVRNDIEIKKYIIDTIPFLLIGVLMFICVINLPNILGVKQIYCLMIQIFVGGVIYMVGSLVILNHKKDETLLNLKVDVKRIMKK